MHSSSQSIFQTDIVYCCCLGDREGSHDNFLCFKTNCSERNEKRLSWKMKNMNLGFLNEGGSKNFDRLISPPTKRERGRQKIYTHLLKPNRAHDSSQETCHARTEYFSHNKTYRALTDLESKIQIWLHKPSRPYIDLRCWPSIKVFDTPLK